MPGLVIFPRGDSMIADLHREAGGPDTVAIGAISEPGIAPVVRLGVPLAAGEYAFGEIDLALLLTACEAFVAVHGDPRGRRITFPPFARGIDQNRRGTHE